MIEFFANLVAEQVDLSDVTLRGDDAVEFLDEMITVGIADGGPLILADDIALL